MKKAAALFMEAVLKYKSIAIYIPGSPDPDAIASAYALKLILKQLLIDSDIFAEKRLSLSQNQALLKRLKIPVIFRKEVNKNKYEAYIIPDYQNNRVEHIGDSIPCAVHIDHHSKSKNSVKADFSLIRTEAGSTSTLVALLVKNLDIDFTENEMAAMATALTFGIQTDTDKYNYLTSMDIEALDYLSDYTDRKALQGLTSVPLSPETIQNYKRAKGNENVYREWAFYGLGYIDSSKRDSIAIIADMILKNSDYSTVAVFAVIENHKKGEMYLDVSLRTNNSAVDLNKLIKRITPNGGGRRFKGAYQVELNYFLSAPDRDRLWDVIEATTLETLHRSRDKLYITGITSIYDDVKDKVLSFIKKA